MMLLVKNDEKKNCGKNTELSPRGRDIIAMFHRRRGKHCGDIFRFLLFVFTSNFLPFREGRKYNFQKQVPQQIDIPDLSE